MNTQIAMSIQEKDDSAFKHHVKYKNATVSAMESLSFEF